MSDKFTPSTGMTIDQKYNLFKLMESESTSMYDAVVDRMQYNLNEASSNSSTAYGVASAWVKTTKRAYTQTSTDTNLLGSVTVDDLRNPNKVLKLVMSQSKYWTTHPSSSCYAYVGIIAAVLDHLNVHYTVYYGIATRKDSEIKLYKGFNRLNADTSYSVGPVHAWVVTSDGTIHETFAGSGTIRHHMTHYRVDPKLGTLTDDFNMYANAFKIPDKPSNESLDLAASDYTSEALIESTTTNAQIVAGLSLCVISIVLDSIGNHLNKSASNQSNKSMILNVVHNELSQKFLSQVLYSAVNAAATSVSGTSTTQLSDIQSKLVRDTVLNNPRPSASLGTQTANEKLVGSIVRRLVSSLLSKVFSRYLDDQDSQDIVDHISDQAVYCTIKYLRKLNQTNESNTCLTESAKLNAIINASIDALTKELKANNIPDHDAKAVISKVKQLLTKSLKLDEGLLVEVAPVAALLVPVLTDVIAGALVNAVGKQAAKKLGPKLAKKVTSEAATKAAEIGTSLAVDHALNKIADKLSGKSSGKSSDKSGKSGKSDSQWITINGTHVEIDNDGAITKGPDDLKRLSKKG